MQLHRAVIIGGRAWRLAAALAIVAGAGAGCRAAGDSPAASLPSRSGDVWVIDPASTRADSPGALMAFTTGTQAILLDGDDAYVGTQRLRAGTGEGGARTLQLAGGLTVQLVPAGDGLDLRFSTGEHVLMKKQGSGVEARP